MTSTGCSGSMWECDAGTAGAPASADDDAPASADDVAPASADRGAPRWTRVEVLGTLGPDAMPELDWLETALRGSGRAILWQAPPGLVAPLSYRRHARLDAWPLSRLRQSARVGASKHVSD